MNTSSWVSLWSLARPRASIVIAASPLIGYWFGLWEHAAALRNQHVLPLLLLAWWLVHVGSLWLNACLDRDQGAVLWGAPCRVPPGTSAAGWGALVLAVGLATLVNSGCGLITFAAAGLAVLYSHPEYAWKTRPVAGPLVNLVGYGVLSPAAGWSLLDLPATRRTVAVAGLLAATALSVYFYAQVFQEREDRSRGYRTLVATHGPAAVVMVSRWCLGLAFVGLAAMSLVGCLPRLCLLVVPGWLALDRWVGRRGARSSEREVRSFVWGLLSLGITLVLLALVDHWMTPAIEGAAGLGRLRG